MKRVITTIILLIGLWHVSASGYMLSKAWLSQYLIKDAWQQTLVDKQKRKPWSWADTYPVATLEVPRLNQISYILEGSSARNLAFSATHLSNSGMPGDKKTIVISGHKDSHFEYLQYLKIGDEIKLKTVSKNSKYTISKMQIVDSNKQNIIISNKDELLLTTCYPFDSLSLGGNLRFIVFAVPKNVTKIIKV